MTPLTRCFGAPIVEERCTALFAALTVEQADEVQEIVGSAFRNCLLDEKQIPQALSFFWKSPPLVPPVVSVLVAPTKLQTPRHTVSESFATYYIPEEPFEGAMLGSEEEINYESFLDKLAAVCDTLA
ncbi:11453_t:CDS:2 [Dentiscutata erythropus]|uniref:11453_t:CDS:1 n=1 Tax=Dentiscutata erythropus TaxID=1348616 RepID=A0A9N9DWE5_9GLOM|nr:11453_t:CDS:2 [Dentiscutata erythropus]